MKFKGMQCLTKKTLTNSELQTGFDDVEMSLTK